MKLSQDNGAIRWLSANAQQASLRPFAAKLRSPRGNSLSYLSRQEAIQALGIS